MATASKPVPGRDETAVQRADRNWNELAQELRVTQTGTQILTAFLLTLPFQPRFADLSSRQETHYLVLVGLAVLTTALMVAPVSLHRFLFQRGRKPEMVRVADRLTRVGLITLALVVIGTTTFVFDIVLGEPATWIAAAACTVLLLALWLGLPWRIGRSDPLE
ncbi:DUF6328 family protein [Bogoriella caseilytica]|uniref:Sodium:proton antiporter n=1 Tax=Bogoriella caseilytica TaxID=56055 RepID=A0A3N2BGK8_9MICO|nr:DUF6328 family protein [Bogoriella caseilytica]ROR74204.1 hypothetical protein EDD31_2605 [Bogoriella caseilytica]